MTVIIDAHNCSNIGSNCLSNGIIVPSTKLLNHVNNGCKASQIPCAISITLFLKSSLVAIKYAKDATNPAIAIGSNEPSPLASVPTAFVIGDKNPPSFENAPPRTDEILFATGEIALPRLVNIPLNLASSPPIVGVTAITTLSITPVIAFWSGFVAVFNPSPIADTMFSPTSTKPFRPKPLENIFENPSGIALMLFSIGDMFPALLALCNHPPNACDSFPKPRTAGPAAVATAPSMATIFCCCEDKLVNQS